MWEQAEYKGVFNRLIKVHVLDADMREKGACIVYRLWMNNEIDQTDPFKGLIQELSICARPNHWEKLIRKKSYR